MFPMWPIEQLYIELGVEPAIICNILREIYEASHHSVKWFLKKQSYFHAFANFHGGFL